MDVYQTTPISDYFTVVADLSSGDLELSDRVKRLIEDIWERESVIRKGELFNGRLLSFVALENERLLGRFVEYKHYIAQLAEPSLKSILQIEPISISGICIAEGKFLVGKRSEMLTQYPGFYELVPSGGIEPSSVLEGRVNIAKQYQNELLEETGIEKTLIRQILPFALVHDLRKEAYEICASIKLEGEVLNISYMEGSEYSQLLWKSKMQLKKFIRENEEKFVPFSLHLVKVHEELLRHEIV